MAGVALSLGPTCVGPKSWGGGGRCQESQTPGSLAGPYGCDGPSSNTLATPTRPASNYRKSSVCRRCYVSAMVVIGDGCHSLFQLDNWLDGRSVQLIALELFLVVPTRHRNSTSVVVGLASSTWISNIIGALTVHVLSLFLTLWDRVQNFSLQEFVQDDFIWRWMGGRYSAALNYNAFFKGSIFFSCSELL